MKSSQVKKIAADLVTENEVKHLGTTGLNMIYEICKTAKEMKMEENNAKRK